MNRGLAKTQFYEAYQKLPWMPNRKQETVRFQLLDDFLAKQRLSYLDYTLAQRLLRDYPNATEDMAFFICHLILAAREGHLCIKIEDQHIEPDAGQLWQREGEPLSLEELQVLNHLIYQGSTALPSSLIMDIKTDLSEWPRMPLCRYQNLVYLQRHWVFESVFLKYFKKQKNGSLDLQPNLDGIDATIRGLCQQGVLLEEQAQAIRNGCIYPFSIITGGPGTGKTYTAGQLIKIFWQNLSIEDRQQCEIALAAPTGKAAAHLQSSLRKAVQDLEGFPTLTAKTLHALLGLKKSSFNVGDKVSQLSADILIVDESSMIDIKLMARLFESLKKGARLILLGDQYQLPSVEAGSVLADLVHLHQKRPDLAVPCTQLQVCLRAEIHSIIDFAKAVNRGETQQALQILNAEVPGIRRLNYDLEDKTSQQAFLQNLLKLFPSILTVDSDPEFILQLFNASRLLSPMRKGSFGVDALNQWVNAQMSKTIQQQGWLAAPILVTANDYRQDLFNGETGVLMRRLPLHPGNRTAFKSDDYAIFLSRDPEQGKVRKIPALLLPKYEYAYCLSVHKSQGSEFNQVILVLPEGSDVFGREVFYTAITRARKQIEICGSDAVIQKTIAQQGQRLSGIQQRIEAEEMVLI